jgi:hypothetical protein
MKFVVVNRGVAGCEDARKGGFPPPIHKSQALLSGSEAR